MTEKQLLNNFVDKIQDTFGVIYYKRQFTIFDYPNITKKTEKKIPKYLLKGLVKEYLKS
jgi:hypothetical protein